MFARSGGALGRYKGAIRYIDSVLDSMLSELDRRGALKNTIVLVTADHGEQFGEHGLFKHGNSLFRPLLHVPLVVLAPGRVQGGVRVPQVVSLRDLAATMLDLAEVPNERGIGGVSLRSLRGGTAAVRHSDVIAEVSQGIRDNPKNPTAAADIKTALDDTVHVILNSRGRVESYAYRTDTAETITTAIDVLQQRAASDWIQQILRRNGVPWRKGQGVVPRRRPGVE